ncbi:MAG: hypothetical protein AB7N54_03980 [Alphaproteobacteria bacterium]
MSALPVVVIGLVAAAAALAVALAHRFLVARAVLDAPNDRSSHSLPTPRGGGIGVLVVLLPAWLALSLWHDAADWRAVLIPAAALGLALVSWRDDIAGLGALPRLLVHVAAAAVGVAALPGPVFHGLFPVWLDATVTVLAWVWFVNLYNFMDGIDGITGVATAALGAGVFAVLAASGTGAGGMELQALALAAAAIGFLAHNWHPARLFLGDVGSVPLGFLAGFLLLALAARGYWGAALILPLYHLADATLTLFRRVLAGERVWQAHRTHFYQRAVRHGRSHATVCGGVALANLALVALATASTLSGPGPTAVAGACAAAAIVVVAALLSWLARAPRSAG